MSSVGDSNDDDGASVSVTSGRSTPAAGVESTKCSDIYISKKECKKTLLAMCVGLVSDDGLERPLGDFDVPPYNTCRKTDNRPTNQIYKDEIARQAKCLNMKAPRPGNWSQQQMLQWLKDNMRLAHCLAEDDVVQFPGLEPVDVQTLNFSH